MGEGANRSFIGRSGVIGRRSYEYPPQPSRKPGGYNPLLPMSARRHRSAGFSLVETLIAILILGIVITTSLFVYYERERRMVEAGEVMLVWQVLGNEAEARRYASWAMQAPGPQPFYTDLALLEQLDGVVAEAAVEQVDPQTRRILLRVSWREGKREAIAEVIRTDTGGGSLW